MWRKKKAKMREKVSPPKRTKSHHFLCSISVHNKEMNLSEKAQ